MNFEMLANKHKKLLLLLNKFDAFVKEHNITYFVASGTCLGAIREKGFIPWDGDVDILMTKPNYDKCESLFMSSEVDGIKWVSYKTDLSAPNLMGRIYEANIDMKHLEEYPYLDLFALVGVPNDSAKQATMMKQSLRNYRIYWLKKRKYSHSLARKKSQIGYILQKMLLLYPSKKCIKKFETDMQEFPYETSHYVAPLTGLYGQKEVLPKQWFDQAPIYVDFCDIKVPVLPNWDEYLIHMYGENYMIPIQFDRYS